MAAIYIVSAQPSLPYARHALLDTLLKKAAHMIEYAVLCALFWQALGTRRLGGAWALTVLYAASDEFHQTFVPGRHGWYGDLVVDAAGALLAALILWRVRRSAR